MSLPGRSVAPEVSIVPDAAPEVVRVYRPGTSIVVGASLLAIALAALAGLAIAVAVRSTMQGDPSTATVASLVVILVVPFALLLWRQSRLRLEVDPVSIRVTNYFSSFRLRWEDVRRFEDRPGSLGITALLENGEAVRLSAVQTPVRWLHGRTEADRTVRELNDRLHRLRYATTSRRISQPARRPDAQGDHGEHQHGDGEPVPHEYREVPRP